MGTTIYLSNDLSDVSGYLKAYVNTRSPNPAKNLGSGSAFFISTTTVDAGIATTLGAATMSAAGTAAQWLTGPFLENVVIQTAPMFNIWAQEDSAATNCQLGVNLKEYSTSEGSAFLLTSIGVELGTSPARVPWVSGQQVGGTPNSETAITATSIDAGNRLLIEPGFTGVQANTVAGVMNIFFDAATAGLTGDSYVVINEDIRMQDSQLGTGEDAPIKGKSHGYFQELQNRTQTAVNDKLINTNATAQMIIDEADEGKQRV
tara:strand:+ start:11 stop:793 length:783 start_codon:yes stop_codon:yes gene_type:complete